MNDTDKFQAVRSHLMTSEREVMHQVSKFVRDLRHLADSVEKNEAPESMGALSHLIRPLNPGLAGRLDEVHALRHLVLQLLTKEAA